MKRSADPSAVAPETLLAHDGAGFGDAVVPPIFQTSLFTFDSFDEMAATFSGRKSRPAYSRGLNPTVRAFEEKIAALEAADDALAFASGMAAISAAALAVLRPGDRLLAVEHVYPDTYRFFETLLADFGIAVAYVDGNDLDAVDAALPGCRLFYLESPTSWMFDPHDLAALTALARKHAVMSIIDNSWASPVFQQPLILGCDLVVHSASKYIGGHSDVVAGVVAGPAGVIDRIRAQVQPYLGAKLAPFEAWLLLRGLRTLPARMRCHERSALTIARRLADRPEITRVHHPALPGPLRGGLRGSSGLFSAVLAPDIDLRRFCDSLRLFRLGVSWGGHESLIIPAAIMHQQQAGPNPAQRFGIPMRMFRLHIGLEHPDDLWADLATALETARI